MKVGICNSIKLEQTLNFNCYHHSEHGECFSVLMNKDRSYKNFRKYFRMKTVLTFLILTLVFVQALLKGKNFRFLVSRQNYKNKLKKL